MKKMYLCFKSLFITSVFINCIKCAEHANKKVYASYGSDGLITIQDFNSNSIVKDKLAEGIYTNSINKYGFVTLEIETNPDIEDPLQSYAVGVIESFLIGDIIYSHWYNTVRDFRETMNKKVIMKIDNFLNENLNWIEKQYKQKNNDPYWHQLNLIYNQIKGIHEGYNKFWSHKYQQISFIDILWLNFFYDVMDLYSAFGGDQIIIGDGHCSVLIKVMPNNSDIYFGHNTWVYYQTMLRVMKKYKFHYKMTKDVNASYVPGIETTFSSYPGTIGSQDDFYLISSGLAVTETTNEMFNKTLWVDSLKSAENIVFNSVRSVIANRLANSGKTWSEIIKLYNSGTYNNQWMIIDYKKFKPGRPLNADTFWVVEQAPAISISQDLTPVLIEKGYWSSYNVPYFDEIYNVTNYKSMFEKYGHWFSHDNAPRAKILKRDHHNVHDMDSFMDLMRSNNYKSEPYARCKCDPPFTATGAIAARDDLNPANGTFLYNALSHRPAGATDAKITNSQLFLKLQFVAVSGPTTGTNGSLPVFKWSESGFNETPHMSHPDVWDFKPTLLKWEL